MLRLGYIVSNMFIESGHRWLILNENFDGLFPCEFDCFAGRNFATGFKNHFSLLFWVELGFGPQEIVSFNEVP